MRRRLLPVFLLFSLGLSGCVADPGVPTSSPAAGEEHGDGEIVVYIGRNQDHLRPVVEAFQSETGIRVQARYASTGELATTILQEGASSPADLFFTQDPAYMGAIAEAQMLQPLPEDILWSVPDVVSGADGDWVGVTARRRVLAYDPARTPESSLPSSVMELTEEQWRGRVGVAPTHSSFVAFVAAMVAQQGEEATLGWLTDLAENNPEIFAGNEEQLRAIAAGDLDVGLVNHYYVHRLTVEDPSTPVVNHSFAPGDPGDVLMPTGIGMLRTSTDQEEALEFIRFLLAEASQQHFLDNVGEYALVPGIGTPPGERPLDAQLIDAMNVHGMAGNLDIATDLIASSGLI